MINSSFGFNIEAAIAIHLVMNGSIWAMNLSNGSKENKKYFKTERSECRPKFHPDSFNPLIPIATITHLPGLLPEEIS